MQRGVHCENVSAIKIESFRGISNQGLTRLGKINSLTGDNNSGKTTILELISGISTPLEVCNWMSVCRKRDGIFNVLSLYSSINTIFIEIKFLNCNKKLNYPCKGNNNHVYAA